MDLLDILRFVTRHPLNASHKGAAVARFVRWQLGSRLGPGAGLVPFVNGSRLLVSRGMRGATGNVYCGLHEFEDMALALHSLRSGDVFVDVGANIGAYSVLAATSGADVLAFEPIPDTYHHLMDNVRQNAFEELIDARNCGVGSSLGTLHFTSTLDTVNHVVSSEESSDDTISVPVPSLDEALAGREPTLLKIDTEGFETEVIAGAEQALARATRLAVIMEANGSGNRYGFDEAALHEQMLQAGFRCYRYAPFERELIAVEGDGLASIDGLGEKEAINMLYVRDAERLASRLRDAAPFRVLNHRI